MESLAKLVPQVPRLAAAWRWIASLHADPGSGSGAGPAPRLEQELHRFLQALPDDLFGRGR